MPRFTVLEPMSTGDVIDRAVRLYRHYFAHLVAISAVPTLIGYIVSLVFWDGVMTLSVPAIDRPQSSGGAGGVILFALIAYPLWFIALVATIAGISRVVGDKVMMDEAITFRRCFSLMRRRLGDLTRLGLFSILILFGVSIIAGLGLGVIMQVVGLVAALVLAASMPTWVITTITVLLGVITIAAFAIFLFILLSRVAFLPQVVMIEGTRAGESLSRVGFLGKGIWHRLAAIVVFAYFVRLSLFAALTLPTFGLFLLFGVNIEEIISSQTANILSASYWEMAGLLSMPILVISVTLLYFDSRVRKDAYDLQLLAGEVVPPTANQPVAPAFGYPTFEPFIPRQSPFQANPLGLDSIILPRAPQAAVPASVQCKQCSAQLMSAARFCSQCGSAVS
jgi:hypothetical protein